MKIQEVKNASPKEGVRLKIIEKIAVGSGGLTGFLGNVAVKSTAISFYQMMLGVNPALLGALLAVPRFWDAFTDPVMGRISDNFKSRFGRRRPFIFFGAILMGLSFGSIWMVPTGWSEYSIAAWFLVSSLIFYTCYTVFAVPFMSLTLEVSSDYDERTSVMGYTSFFSKLGELSYQWVVPIASISYFSSTIVGVQTVCWGLALFGMILCGCIPALFVKERYYELSQKKSAKVKKTTFVTAVKQTLNNRAFGILIGLTILQIIAGILGSSLDYYLLVYYMFDGDIGEGSKWKAILSSGYAIMGFVGIPIVLKWSKRTSKLKVLRGIYLLVILNSVMRWFLYQPGNSWIILLDPVIGSLFWIAVGTVKQSMMADICDQDEVEYGQRREGTFSSVFGWITKTALSLSFFASGVILEWIGFDVNLGGNQSSGTFLGMRLSMVLGGIVPSLMALVVLRYYPIDRKESEENKRILESRRGVV